MERQINRPDVRHFTDTRCYVNSITRVLLHLLQHCPEVSFVSQYSLLCCTHTDKALITYALRREIDGSHHHWWVCWCKRTVQFWWYRLWPDMKMFAGFHSLLWTACLFSKTCDMGCFKLGNGFLKLGLLLFVLLAHAHNTQGWIQKL